MGQGKTEPFWVPTKGGERDGEDAAGSPPPPPRNTLGKSFTLTTTEAGPPLLRESTIVFMSGVAGRQSVPPQN